MDFGHGVSCSMIWGSVSNGFRAWESGFRWLRSADFCKVTISSNDFRPIWCKLKVPRTEL